MEATTAVPRERDAETFIAHRIVEELVLVNDLLALLRVDSEDPEPDGPFMYRENGSLTPTITGCAILRQVKEFALRAAKSIHQSREIQEPSGDMYRAARRAEDLCITVAFAADAERDFLELPWASFANVAGLVHDELERARERAEAGEATS